MILTVCLNKFPKCLIEITFLLTLCLGIFASLFQALGISAQRKYALHKHRVYSHAKPALFCLRALA